LLSWRYLKKKRFDPRKKLGSRLILGFGLIFYALGEGLKMGWTGLWECFLDIWGRKLIYRWQTLGTLIFRALQWLESGYTKRRVICWGRGHIVFFSRLNWGGRAPLFYKKSSHDWAWRCGPSCEPFSHGPNTRLDLIICFFFFFYLKLYLYLLKNNF